MADDTLVAGTNGPWLQGAVDLLTELFARMGLQTNISKTKMMSCTPGYIRTTVSDAAYRRHTGEGGDTHRAQQRRRVTCSECGKDLAQGSLGMHLRSQHGVLGGSS